MDGKAGQKGVRMGGWLEPKSDENLRLILISDLGRQKPLVAW